MSKNKFKIDFAIVFIVIVLVMYFLYNTGFIFELSNEPGRSSISLSIAYLKQAVHPEIRTTLYSTYSTAQDVFSAQWLNSHLNRNTTVYSDRYSTNLAMSTYGLYNLPNKVLYIFNSTAIKQNSCIYLSYMNTVDGLLVNLDPNPQYRGPLPRRHNLPLIGNPASPR